MLRRDVLLYAVAGLASGLSSAAGQLGSIRVRKDFARLTYCEKLRLAEAFRILKRNPWGPKSCISLFVQASIHGSFYQYQGGELYLDQAQGSDNLRKPIYNLAKSQPFKKVPADLAAIFNQCEHNKPQRPLFLIWHRMFLFFFENAIRAIGSDFRDFTLPFWNSASDRELPIEFRDDTSPLFCSMRLDKANAGQLKLEYTLPFRTSRQDFVTRSLFGGVHSAVHDRLGLPMSLSEMAAWDPIFFLHHANIDRIWAAWQRSTSEGFRGWTNWPLTCDPFAFAMPSSGGGDGRKEFVIAKPALGDFINVSTIPVRYSVWQDNPSYSYQAPSVDSDGWREASPAEIDGTSDGTAVNPSGDSYEIGTKIDFMSGRSVKLRWSSGMLFDSISKVTLVVKGIRLTERGCLGGFDMRLWAAAADSDDVLQLGRLSPFALRSQSSDLCGISNSVSGRIYQRTIPAKWHRHLARAFEFNVDVGVGVAPAGELLASVEGIYVYIER